MFMFLCRISVDPWKLPFQYKPFSDVVDCCVIAIKNDLETERMLKPAPIVFSVYPCSLRRCIVAVVFIFIFVLIATLSWAIWNGCPNEPVVFPVPTSPLGDDVTTVSSSSVS